MHDPIARRLQTAYEDPTSDAISSYHDRVTIVTQEHRESAIYQKQINALKLSRQPKEANFWLIDFQLTGKIIPIYV